MTTPNNPENNPPAEEEELSHDKELWDILGQSEASHSSPLFSRNVLREIRLQENDSATTPSFWRKLLNPRFVVPGALAALALTAALIWKPSNSSGNTLAETTVPEALPVALPVAVATSLENSLESELLLAAADTPSLFSDEEVFAMLF